MKIVKVGNTVRERSKIRKERDRAIIIESEILLWIDHRKLVYFIVHTPVYRNAQRYSIRLVLWEILRR